MEQKIKYVFYDVETTGLDVNKCAIHEISGCIVVGNVIQEYFTYHLKPFKDAKYERGAIRITGISVKQMMSYPEQDKVFIAFKKLLNKYVNKYDKQDKYHLVGYYNRSFDDLFLRQWFLRNGDKYFGSYFYSNSIDVSVLASEILKRYRRIINNYKLVTIARHLGIEVDDTQLHKASYDIYLTIEVYNELIKKIDRPNNDGIIDKV